VPMSHAEWEIPIGLRFGTGSSTTKVVSCNLPECVIIDP